MSGAEEDRKRAARAEQAALFRYQLIRLPIRRCPPGSGAGWSVTWPPGPIRDRPATR